MSRAGYSDDIDNWQLIRWRGQVASSIRGKRGQAFLRELIEALDAMPEKRLIDSDLQRGSEVCAIGSVGLKRGVDMSKLDPEQPDVIAGVFGIAEPLVREIEYMNDEAHWNDTPEQRWRRMREWAASSLASRMEAQRAETENTGSTAEGGDSLTAESGDAQTPSPSSRERK